MAWTEFVRKQEFTDAEAEAFTRYLTELKKPKKKKLVRALLETQFGQDLIREYLRSKGIQI